MLSDGEPAFFAMFLVFALLILLGIVQNMPGVELIPALYN
jgi:hypothetical protein